MIRMIRWLWFLLTLAALLLGLPLLGLTVFGRIVVAHAGPVDSRLHLNETWALSKGSEKIIVAVIDTGADITHPALRDSLWVNPGESGVDAKGLRKENNQIDDDKNGYIDDVNGWNFADNNNDLSDHHGHGTHIAGLIAGKRLSPFEFQGVAPNAKLMILKYYDPASLHHHNLDNSTEAIRYAIKMKAVIINFSSGGDEKSAAEELVIREASRAQILFVAAAGNDGLNNDKNGFYPATYQIDNLISVASLRSGADRLLSSSNFGRKSVDIAAPGEDIFSTMPGGRYGPMTGTSQATALVTGVAALFMSLHPEIKSPVLIKNQLISVGDFDSQLINSTKTAGTLNALTALTTLPEGQNAFGESIYSLQRLNRELFTIRSTQALPLLKR